MLKVAVTCALLIALIWFGYPLFVWGMAALRRGARTNPAGEFGEVRWPRVTVIVASVDPEPLVRARVADLLAGDYPPALLDVLVAVDANGSVDPESFADLAGRVRVLRGDQPGGKAASLNAAVRQAAGDILVFTDTAQRFAPDTIRRLVVALADPRFGAVSGALQIGRDGVPATLSERYWILEKWLREQEARWHSTVGVTGAVYAMRRICWHPLPPGLILDDVYGPMHLVMRGFRVGFEPSATAIDERRFPAALELRRKARTLTGVVQLCAWLPAVLVPWRNPLWLQFLFHKVLRLATPYLLLVGGVAFAAWLVTAARAHGSAPWGMALGTALAVASGGALAGVLVSARVRHTLAMALALQVAVVKATVNGCRGRWDVWSR